MNVEPPGTLVLIESIVYKSNGFAIDGMCFQIFLDQLAEKYPAHLNVIQLDNGNFHQSSRLKIPDNILLIF